MRTTLDIDDALLAEAKRRAADKGTTLTAFVEHALARSDVGKLHELSGDWCREHRRRRKRRPHLPLSLLEFRKRIWLIHLYPHARSDTRVALFSDRTRHA